MDVKSEQSPAWTEQPGTKGGQKPANPYSHIVGKTTIAPEVLLTIAKLTTLEVSGVSRMSPVPGSVNRLFHRGASNGVQIVIENGVVTTDLYVVLEKDVNLRDVSRNIQHNVSRAISEMVGMQVGRVNIHIEDVDYPQE
jgi:uncharacterized alkaline shock family protein YloU